jgi:hypothetical protein
VVCIEVRRGSLEDVYRDFIGSDEWLSESVPLGGADVFEAENITDSQREGGAGKSCLVTLSILEELATAFVHELALG